MTTSDNTTHGYTNSIQFPRNVKPTPCTTIPYTVITHTRHGIVKEEYNVPVWMLTSNDGNR